MGILEKFISLSSVDLTTLTNRLSDIEQLSSVMSKNKGLAELFQIDLGNVNDLVESLKEAKNETMDMSDAVQLLRNQMGGISSERVVELLELFKEISRTL